MKTTKKILALVLLLVILCSCMGCSECLNGIGKLAEMTCENYNGSDRIMCIMVISMLVLLIAISHFIVKLAKVGNYALSEFARFCSIADAVLILILFIFWLVQFFGSALSIGGIFSRIVQSLLWSRLITLINEEQEQHKDVKR